MTDYISNGTLKIGVKHFGAVLTSIKSEKSGFEYLWQGNAEIWNGQSPILFPVIGKMLDDKYAFNGKEYPMIRHGLARHYNFNLIKKSDTQLIFEQTENEETLASYPFKYVLRITFTLDGNSLTVKHTVINKNDCTMYFSIGAHPAFNCEISDKIVFEKEETLLSERIDANSVLLDEKDLIAESTNTLTIEENTFDKDAMIFSSLNSDYAVLESRNTERKIKFTFGDAPFFAIWSKPNSPFVCLEPWYGINDSYKKADDISEKRGIQKLEKSEEFSFEWTAQFSE